VLLSARGEQAEAEQLLREVVEAYPDNHDAAYMLALLLVERQRPAEALTFLERAASGMPRNSRAWYNLGLLRQSLGQDPAARQALIAAVDLEPENPDYLYALADHYLKRARFTEALPIARRLAAAVPEAEIGPQLVAYIEAALAEGGDRQ
jgi:tetratricopeptide (TPR) repeat protein